MSANPKGICRVCGKPAFRPDGEFCSRECFRKNIHAGRDQRAERDQAFADLFARADAAGRAAAEATRPTPMVVQQHRDVLDDASPVVQEWVVPSGVCGFAWVTIHPATSAAARYAKKHLGARTAYRGGMEIWVAAYGQSMELKEAYAHAYARVLRDAGLKAYSGSRMD